MRLNNAHCGGRGDRSPAVLAWRFVFDFGNTLTRLSLLGWPIHIDTVGLPLLAAHKKLAKDETYLNDAMKSLGFKPEFVDGKTVAARLKWAINDNKEVQDWLMKQIALWKAKK